MKIGLALGSGSSRGWAHIGILEALEELGIHPTIVAGTSIGAIVGAAYAADRLALLKTRLASFTRLDLARFFRIGRSRSFVDTAKLQDFFDQYVVSPDTRIEDLPIRYATVATALESGREVWLTTGLVTRAIWASIALPGVFAPYWYQGHWFLDGGLVNPVPVSVCRALGADVVIAVNLNGDLLSRYAFAGMQAMEAEGKSGDWGSRISRVFHGGKHKGAKQQPAAPGFVDTLAASINIVQERITRSRMAGDPPDLVLMPRLAHVSLLEFYRGEEAIEEGRQAVRRMLPMIESLLGRERGDTEA